MSGNSSDIDAGVPCWNWASTTWHASDSPTAHWCALKHWPNIGTTETHVVSYVCRYLPEPAKTNFLNEVEEIRSIVFAEDRILNMAAARWDVNYIRIRSGSQ